MPGVYLSACLLLVILALLFCFHLLVLAGKIPTDIVWAGKIKSRKELVKLESISLIVLAIAAGIIAMQMSCLNSSNHPTVIKIGVWVLFAFFTLNTIGNLTAKSQIEKYGFGLLTLIMAILTLNLALAG